jgi:hypothetical protein
VIVPSDQKTCSHYRDFGECNKEPCPYAHVKPVGECEYTHVACPLRSKCPKSHKPVRRKPP